MKPFDRPTSPGFRPHRDLESPLALRLPLLLLGLLMITQPLGAATAVEDYLRELPGYQFQVLDQSDSAAEAAASGTFERTVLSDLMLTSFSRWNVRSADASWRARLEVYEMLDPQAAFSLFTLARSRLASTWENLTVPPDSLVTPDRALSWSGNYFFHFTRWGTTELDASGIEPLAAALAKLGENESLYPMTVTQLPLQDLNWDSIRYYLSESLLFENEELPLALRGRLGFDEHPVEVSAASYQPGDRVLFLFGYPNASLAEEYSATIHGFLQSVFSPEGLYLKRSGLVIALCEGPQDEVAPILERVEYHASVKWIYEKGKSADELQAEKKEVISFLGIVSRSIIFTGVFILVVLFFGILAGGARYYILKTYPQIGEKDETIFLDLSNRDSKASQRDNRV